MIRPTRELQAADHGALELDSVVTALSAQFTVSTGARQLVRRRRLDTFDRRLQAAGVTLEHHVTAVRGMARRETALRDLATRDLSTPDPAERLVLGRADGSPTVTVPVSNVRWPAPAAALPVGPVRDAIAPVAGIRALMVVSDQRRRVRRLDLRNPDGKTVVRVELDEPASTKAGAAKTARPAQLTVRGLRGYDEPARRADRLLAAMGLRAVERPRDRGPVPASGTSVPRVTDRAVPARLLLQAALGDFLATMRENLPGLLEDVDTEFLHDFRVAVRRTRATLKLGRPALPDDMRLRWEPAFKSWGDLTTPVRDLDVYELDLPAMSSWLVGPNPADLRPLATHLRRRRTTARHELVRSLRSTAFRRMLTEWGEALADLGEPGGSTDIPGISAGATGEELSAGQLADRSIARAYRRVARDGALITADSPTDDLHGLRKRCKELRYALEVFAPLIDQAVRKQAVTDLKGLQDVLGRFQDTEVQRRAMRGFAEEMMAEGTTADTVLAMGELIGHLDVEQARARLEFDDAFSGLERPSSLRLIDRLGGGS